MENSLPKGWVECLLGDIAKIQNGFAFPSKDFKKQGDVPLIKQSQLNGDHVSLENCVYLDKNYLETKSDFVLKKGDVLIGMSGSIGKLCIYDLDIPALQNQRTGKVVPSTIVNRKLLWYYLSTIEEALKQKGKGLGVTNVSANDIENLPFSLPPLHEQQRIVAKLDELMEKIDRSRARLERIPQILKRFRQSILSAAVTGKLTEEWRERNGIIGEWEFKKAEEVCELITKGTTPTNNGLQPYGDIPYLKVYNIVDQKIDFNYKPQYVSRDIHNNFLKRSRVYPGDVLMNIVGPPLGKVAIVPNDFDEWNINQAIAFFRAKEFVLPEFIYLILCEGAPIVEIEKEFRGTAGQSNISLEQCRNFIFPIPGIKEQREIIIRVKHFQTLADKIEARYNKAKAQLDKLPQALLAKAFRGELVPQNENDEPASVLLERIREQKENKNIAKTKSRKIKVYELQEEIKIAAEPKRKYAKAKQKV